jgi:glutamate racemase
MFMLAVERFAAGLTLVNQPCPGLVERIEAGDIASAELEAALREMLRPMLNAGADTVVLACTHYPFVLPLIERIAGDSVHVLDPAPAVARHLGRLLAQRGLAAHASTKATHQFATTGSAPGLRSALRALLGRDASVEAVEWRSGAIAGRRAA